MKQDSIDTELTAKICDIVLRERNMSLSEREWKFRLRGYGYAIRDTDVGRVVTSLINGSDLCTLPEARPKNDVAHYAA